MSPLLNILFHCSAVFVIAFSLTAPRLLLAGEVNLEEAGCAELPDAGRFMSINLVLDGDGNGRDCIVSTEPKYHCERANSFDEGFLCLGLTHNPRPDITAAETASSARVDRLIVDGEEVEDEFGKTILRRDLATGPSGENYLIVVQQSILGKSYSMTVEVTASADGPIKFNAVNITYD